MDDAAEPNDGVDTEGHQLAELIYDVLQAATRHANAPTVVLLTVLHLLRTSDLAAALTTPAPGLHAAMEAAPPPGTHATPPGSPDSQDQAQQPTPPSPPQDDHHHPTDATPTNGSSHPRSSAPNPTRAAPPRRAR